MFGDINSHIDLYFATLRNNRTTLFVLSYHNQDFNPYNCLLLKIETKQEDFIHVSFFFHFIAISVNSSLTFVSGLCMNSQHTLDSGKNI